LLLSKFFAALLIALIVAPFTEPWPVCPLPQLLGDPSVAAVPVAVAPVEGVGQAAIGTSSGSTEPDVTNPITLLPPPRTDIGTLRASAAAAPAVLPPARKLPIPIPRTAESANRSGLAVSPLTPALRV
jgi:hypothetical protein